MKNTLKKTTKLQMSKFLFFDISICLVLYAFTSLSLHANTLTGANGNIALIDSFDHTLNNQYGYPRQYLDDSIMGGQTKASHKIEKGMIYLSGEIVPPRGQLGWASSVLLLNEEGKPTDLSDYEGISVRIKVKSGGISISANSTEIDNFDYHATVINAPTDGQFHNIKVPFSSLKRAWSEQTPINTKTINSLSIVAFGLQTTTYDFEIDEISLY